MCRRSISVVMARLAFATYIHIIVCFVFFTFEKYYIYIDSIQMIKGNDKEKMLQ